VDLEELPVASQPRPTLLSPVPEEEPLDVVIDALRGVTCETPVEAASLCLAWCVRALHARAGIVHLYDPASDELVVVYALGDGAGHLILTRHALTDEAIAAAIARGVPRVRSYGEGRPAPARYGLLGGPWSALVAPVMDGETPLAVLELLDPLDGSCFDERAVSACCYAAKRLAELLAGVGGSIGAIIRAPEDA
jgi:hypothetical protein